MTSSSRTSRAVIDASPRVIELELDAFDAAIRGFRAGRVPESAFTETRLRQGVYGQRQEGVHMIRVKLPLGIVDADQLRGLGRIAESFGHGIAHLTTRQDVQFHFAKLEETPELLRELGRFDVTAREACGNVVRNVTADASAGVSTTEIFDVTDHGVSLARALLRNPVGQDLGRKFKIRLSGEPDTARNEALFHDLGLVARVQNGARGFAVHVGGGLGAIPYAAQLLYEFVREDELLSVALATIAVFGERGERKRRAKARLKFLVADLGLDAFRSAVEEQRRLRFPVDGSWLELSDSENRGASAAWNASAWLTSAEARVQRWLDLNVERQRQAGFALVRVKVERGDLTRSQLDGVAQILDRYPGSEARLDVTQDLVLRWVPVGALVEVYAALVSLDLAQADAAAAVTCPGADTCKLGITSPRTLAAGIRSALSAFGDDPRVAGLSVHVSGCPNSCARHQIADIGLHGAARTVNGASMPHYAVILGARGGGESFGVAHGKVPARRVSVAIGALVGAWVHAEPRFEAFADWVAHQGRAGIKELLAPFDAGAGGQGQDDLLYVEPERDGAFEIRRGTGECAGEVVGAADLHAVQAEAASERSLALAAVGNQRDAVEQSRRALVLGASALVAADGGAWTDEAGLREQFAQRFVGAKRFPDLLSDVFLGSFDLPDDLGPAEASRLVDGARLFVEEVHTFLAKAREVRS